ncbi:MAG: NAD(P)/FAD-dependent oxidoreductase [Devosia sp.]|uniref:FAD-dependent oxidoreductase n=1 Tax=Devosia sp. TaxID=1871048 RepID=UPI003398B314
MRKSLEIAIVGAGPGGLSTALFLKRSGHRVTIFERFETPHPVGSGLMLQPTGLAVLDALGLRSEMAGLGARVSRLTGTDSRSGRKVLDVSYRPLGRNIHAIGVHRATLFDVLHNAVLQQDIRLVTDFTATGHTAAAGGHWLESDGRREGPFDLIVDASGARSPLRASARFGGGPKPLEYGAIWSTVPWIDGGFDREALTQRYRKASVMIGVLPIGRRTLDGPELAAFFWSLKPDDYETVRARGIAAWHAEVLSHWPDAQPHLDNMSSFEDMTLARYAHGTMRVPAGEGIAFIGDSAHCTSPQLGQGANMALLDAAALSAAIERSTSIEDALDLYCRMRRWHVRFYQFMSIALTPFYQSDSAVLPLLRDIAISSGAKIPPIPWLLAGLVSGQLLNPLRRIGLPPALYPEETRQ